jgi:hypothetical protein
MSEKLSLLLFILKVLGLFLIFLAIYYYLSPFLLLFTAKLVNFVLIGVFDRFIDSINLLNREIEVVTNFSVAGNNAGRLAFDINPLKYSYGFPVFLALIFSSFSTKINLTKVGKISSINTAPKFSDELINKLLKCIFAYFVISLAQVWGISFDIVRHLIFEFNGAYAGHFQFSSIQSILLSYGSQLGFLLLPSLSPILLWIYLENKQFKKLINNQ